MAKQTNYSLLRSNKYKLSIVIILLLGSIMWLFFSVKIIQNRPNLEAAKINSQEKTGNLITNIETIADLQPRKSRSRNRENSQPLNKKEYQEYIEALRESFEKVKPTQNNKIIRGEITPSKKTIADRQSTNIEELLNDKLELKNLNREYKNALEDINARP